MATRKDFADFIAMINRPDHLESIAKECGEVMAKSLARDRTKHTIDKYVSGESDRDYTGTNNTGHRESLE